MGAAGGAIEIDGGRNHKRNIHIHNNVTRNNMGFLEISWEHDIEPRATENVVVEHNISHDYITKTLSSGGQRTKTAVYITTRSFAQSR